MTEDEKRQYQNAWSRKRYRSRKEHGLCVDCGKEKAIDGNRLCASCRSKRNEYVRDSRIFYQSIGICPVCRKHSISGDEKVCLECAARRRTYPYNHSQKVKTRQKNHYAESKAKHICPSCGKPAAPGKVRCQMCLEKNREAAMARRGPQTLAAKWKEDNLCIRCGKPVRPGTSFCEEHYRKSLIACAMGREEQKNRRIYYR